jgi:hypothetical protein
MLVKPCDTLLAIKSINLMPGLCQSDRQVGAILLEHFNRRTGRCDPGIERIAGLLGCCTRTVIRSTARLEKAGLFRKVRHGGYSNRNSYEPNWAQFAQHEVAWKGKLQQSSRLRRPELSHAAGHESHSPGDSPVTQTYSTNLHKQTSHGLPRRENRYRPRPDHLSQSSAHAARVQAERRWSDALLHRYAHQPVTYAEIIELIDPELSSAATAAELSRQGAGLRVIQQQLKLPAG